MTQRGEGEEEGAADGKTLPASSLSAKRPSPPRRGAAPSLRHRLQSLGGGGGAGPMALWPLVGALHGRTRGRDVICPSPIKKKENAEEQSRACRRPPRRALSTPGTSGAKEQGAAGEERGDSQGEARPRHACHPPLPASFALRLPRGRRMFQTLYSYFWWDRLWLPANLTWADLKDQDGQVDSKGAHLCFTIPLAFAFLVVRHFFEIYVATPLAGLLNVKEKARLKASPNPMLEKFYSSSCKHPKQADIEALSKKNGCTPRQIERWFRRRRNQDRPSLLKKFREASWRFTFYLIAFIAGMAVIVDKPWFYDLRQVWVGYPIQNLLPSQYWYYIIELSFYWSLLFSIASDVKRKDFKEQVIHHLATIILISFSWFTNYIRAGTLIMALHDSSDSLLESAKMFNYAGWKNTCNNIFIIFAVVFIITRLIILPFWILHCTIVLPLELYPPFFGYYFFNLMMVILQCLHVFWAYLIIRMAQKFITGKTVEDERSDRDETDYSEEEEKTATATAGSGTKNGPLTNGHPVLNNNHRKAE